MQPYRFKMSEIEGFRYRVMVRYLLAMELLESVLVFVVFVRMPLGASHMLPVSASVLKLCCMLLDCCCCFSKKG